MIHETRPPSQADEEPELTTGVPYELGGQEVRESVETDENNKAATLAREDSEAIRSGPSVIRSVVPVRHQDGRPRPISK